MSKRFFQDLPLRKRFDELAQSESYTPLPDDWLIGIADIEGSSDLIEAGAYKTVNTIGVAVISAQLNTHKGRAFPYVFGGDGAVFAVPPEDAERAREALGAVSCWAREEFDITLRIASATVAEIRAGGKEVSIARYHVSKDADYSMFSGGGVSWLEEEMKAGRFRLPPAPPGTRPDLTGLSCRWRPMRSRYGLILSLVALPEPGADPQVVANVFREIIALEEQLERIGNPVNISGSDYPWVPVASDIEARASNMPKPLWRRKLSVWLDTVIAIFLFRTGLKVSGFDIDRYVRVLGANADFRKFDDGLKMTIDCDFRTRDRIIDILKSAASRELIRYGVYEQDAAIMTCIVPSAMKDDHVHFIDGAAGGYTAAANRMKAGG